MGRTSSHRKAMLRNLASSLILTQRQVSDLDPNPPKVQGRVVTTLEKAKEVRPLVEKCVALACRSLKHQRAAEEFSTQAARGTDAWKEWRKSERWRQWTHARAPAVAARRRALQLLGDKKAVRVLFDEVAPRFEDRPGGYTRVLRLAKPRLGDAGTRAILEFVGQHDRKVQRGPRPTIAADDQGSERRAAAAADQPSAEPSSS